MESESRQNQSQVLMRKINERGLQGPCQVLQFSPFRSSNTDTSPFTTPNKREGQLRSSAPSQHSSPGPGPVKDSAANQHQRETLLVPPWQTSRDAPSSPKGSRKWAPWQRTGNLPWHRIQSMGSPTKALVAAARARTGPAWSWSRHPSIFPVMKPMLPKCQ